MLNEIREKLEGLQMGPVEYGRLTSVPEICNYIVFARGEIKKAGTSSQDFNREYTVVLVHEDYIPEGTELEVVKALKEIKGLRWDVNAGIQYDYMVKKNNDTVVEMAAMVFKEPLKGYVL